MLGHYAGWVLTFFLAYLLWPWLTRSPIRLVVAAVLCLTPAVSFLYTTRWPLLVLHVGDVLAILDEGDLGSMLWAWLGSLRRFVAYAIYMSPMALPIGLVAYLLWNKHLNPARSDHESQ